MCVILKLPAEKKKKQEEAVRMEKTDDVTDVMKLKKFDGNHENFNEWLNNFENYLTMMTTMINMAAAMIMTTMMMQTMMTYNIEANVMTIEMEYGVKFDEEEKIAQALIALGPEYGEKMNDKAKTLEEKGETVTFVELMEGAKEKWRVSGKGARMKQEVPVESSLTDANLGSNADVANTGGRHANKTCYHCGRTGHIKIDCPEWIQFKRNMKNAVCGYPGCGQKGHTTARCWEDPANAKHRPPGWVSRISKLDTGVCEVFV